MAPRIQVRAASEEFLGIPALEDVSFHLDEGEILALVGENGAGKSTLIRILSGAHEPSSGTVEIDGRVVTIDSPKTAERLGIATVYQELSLFPQLSVAENLLFSSFPDRARVRWRHVREEAAKFLAELGLGVPVDATVASLSIAEKQMLEIAKALHRNARILILDEPTAVLGGSDVDHLLELVRGLARKGVSVIFVSHRLDEVFGLADRYLVLKDGRVSGEGPLAQTSHDQLVSLMVGREFRHKTGENRSEPGDVVLDVDSISRQGVLSDISFCVHAGEVVGIAGLRGAGRTELARAIYGADPLDAGTVRMNGKPLTLNPRAAIEAGIGLVPEERKSEGLFTSLSTAANIPVAWFAKAGTKFSTSGRERALALNYKRRLHIKVSDVGAPVATLSGGNQQKVVLAKWLQAGVKLLILDEPTRGIDIGAKQEIYEMISDLCRSGLAVLVISSELPEVIALSHRVLVMHRGAIAAELSNAEATEERIMHFAVGGMEP
ncbi:sugar ABC transporter ATP-binding protein [Mycolicibacterium brisbanense]